MTLPVTVGRTTLGTMRTAPEANRAAAERAANNPHRALLRDGAVHVISNTDPSLEWVIGAVALPGEPVLFHCQAIERKTGHRVYDAGHGDTNSPQPGVVPCVHAHKSAKRLQREGLINFRGGLWVAVGEPQLPDLADPFEGLC